MQKRRKSTKRRKKFILIHTIQVIGVVLLIALFFNIYSLYKNHKNENTIKNIYEISDIDTLEVIKDFAAQKNIDISQYPKSIIELLERNPEAEDFVLNYPLEYGNEHNIDLSEYRDSNKVPLFMQWDKRWGYIDYGSDVVGITGCGPICLSMVGYHLTKDEVKFRPDNVIKFALKKGYCIEGKGSSWKLISEGGKELGLNVTETYLDKNNVIKSLNAGNPVICVMGPGVFTSSGHFIVIVGTEDGKFKINDPNSKANSESLWEWEEFSDQIRNLWIISN